MNREPPKTKDYFPFNLNLCNPLYSTPPPPIRINNLYQVNGRVIEANRESQMTNLNILMQKWDSSLKMHDTSYYNHVHESNTPQNTLQGSHPLTYDRNLSSHHEVFSMMDNNCYFNSSATFNSQVNNSSNFPKINETIPFMYSSNLSSQCNNSSATDKNRFLNSSPAFNSLNSLNYTKLSKKNETLTNSNISPRYNSSSAMDSNRFHNNEATFHNFSLSEYPKINERKTVISSRNLSSTLDSNRFHNNEATFHNFSLSEYPKINERKTVISSRNLSPTLDSNRFLNKSASLAFKDSYGDCSIKKGEGIQRSSNYYYRTQPKIFEPIGHHYVNAINKSNSKPEVNGFIVNNKDFPELPSSKPKNVHNTMSSTKDQSQQSSTNETNELYTDNINNEISTNGNTNFQMNNTRPQTQTFLDGNAINNETPSTSDFNTNFQTNNATPQIQTCPEGKITNIPGSMLRDQFGIACKLANMRYMDLYPELTMLCNGIELNTIELNFRSPEIIHTKFSGPFDESFLGPNHLDFDVPPEYRVNDKINLPPIRFHYYDDLLLFYLFYSHHCDNMQLSVADELYARNWRFHTELCVWITNISGMNLLDKSTGCEDGIFYVFDTEMWRQVPRRFILDYSKLERRLEKN